MQPFQATGTITQIKQIVFEQEVKDCVKEICQNKTYLTEIHFIFSLFNQKLYNEKILKTWLKQFLRAEYFM